MLKNLVLKGLEKNMFSPHVVFRMILLQACRHRSFGRFTVLTRVEEAWIELCGVGYLLSVREERREERGENGLGSTCGRNLKL